MRRRLVAVFMLLTAMLGSSLTGASPVHAEGPDDPVCRLSLLGTLDVICTVPPKADGLRILFIEWTKNGDNLDQFDGIRQISMRCSPGESFMIGVRIGFDGIGDGDAGDVIPGSTQFTCPTRQVSQIFYYPSPTAGLPGGNYIICEMQWATNGGSATVEWVNPQAKRRPAVSVYSAESRSRATYDCNNPGGPDLTFYAFVRVTDAFGSMTTPLTIPCGW